MLQAVIGINSQSVCQEDTFLLKHNYKFKPYTYPSCVNKIHVYVNILSCFLPVSRQIENDRLIQFFVNWFDSQVFLFNVQTGCSGEYEAPTSTEVGMNVCQVSEVITWREIFFTTAVK